MKLSYLHEDEDPAPQNGAETPTPKSWEAAGVRDPTKRYVGTTYLSELYSDMTKGLDDERWRRYPDSHYTANSLVGTIFDRKIGVYYKVEISQSKKG